MIPVVFQHLQPKVSQISIPSVMLKYSSICLFVFFWKTTEKSETEGIEKPEKHRKKIKTENIEKCIRASVSEKLVLDVLGGGGRQYN